MARSVSVRPSLLLLFSSSRSRNNGGYSIRSGCNYVYIGGLPYTLTEGDVECMMSQFGTVTDLKLVRNEDTNESKGFGFVQYADW